MGYFLNKVSAERKEEKHITIDQTERFQLITLLRQKVFHYFDRI